MEMSVTAALLNIKRRAYFDCQTTCFVQVARGKAVKKRGCTIFPAGNFLPVFINSSPRANTRVVTHRPISHKKAGKRRRVRGKVMLLPQDGHVDTHLWSMGCLGRRVGGGGVRWWGVSGWAGGLSGQTGVINLAVQPSFACMISSFRFLSLPVIAKCSRE